MAAMTTEAQTALETTTTEALLTAAYALTHRMHERGAHAVDLRAQRDLIDAELVRRTQPVPARRRAARRGC